MFAAPAASRRGATSDEEETASWSASEPLGFDGGDSNLYRYVGNSPPNAADPTGERQAGNPLTDLRIFRTSTINPLEIAPSLIGLRLTAPSARSTPGAASAVSSYRHSFEARGIPGPLAPGQTPPPLPSVALADAALAIGERTRRLASSQIPAAKQALANVDHWSNRATTFFSRLLGGESLEAQRLAATNKLRALESEYRQLDDRFNSLGLNRLSFTGFSMADGEFGQDGGIGLFGAQQAARMAGRGSRGVDAVAGPEIVLGGAGAAFLRGGIPAATGSLADDALSQVTGLPVGVTTTRTLRPRPMGDVDIGTGIAADQVARSRSSTYIRGRYSQSASNHGAYWEFDKRVFPTRRNSGLSGSALRSEQAEFFERGLEEAKSPAYLRGQAATAGYERRGGINEVGGPDRLADKGAEKILQEAIRKTRTSQ